MPENPKGITANHWSENMAGSDAFSPEIYWLAVPEVQKRFRQLACRGSDFPAWVQYCVGAFLDTNGPVANMLSIGCGSGALERDLFRLNAFHHCDAIDIAPAAIETALREAVSIGARSIDYRVTDVEKTNLPEVHYDAVWFNGSLHHIQELEAVCERVRGSLKPNGWLFFNEYVGANHFAFGPQQVAAITHAFAMIPERYRLSFVNGSFGQVQHLPPLPDPVEVVRVDPSEAVRSQDILKVVEDYFDIHTLNPCGGSLLQFLLHGIAGNFRQEDPNSIRILQMLFDIEDGLIESGVLKSDFVVVAATPRLDTPRP
ncbi:MAG: class I SAM-dependent methyltransferase [Nitrosospira sp.]|nr:class I SAM-dependent methyltransferase [Nitrosospira sp.]